MTAFAQNADRPRVTIVNNTGYTTYYLYIKSTADDSWGSDFLGSSVISNENSFTVTMPYALNVVNRYDIQLKDSDGDTYTKNNVLISNNSRVVFTFDDFDRRTSSTSTTATGPSITVVNNTGYTGYYLYVKTTADSNWGSDLLGSDILSNDRSTSIRLPHPLNVVNRYDFRLRDSDGDTYTKNNVLVSNNARIVFTFDDFDRSSSTSSSNSTTNPSITIVNNTGYTVYYVYISSSESSNWGDDWLGSSEVLMTGESKTFRLQQPLNVVNRYDFRIRDSDGDNYTKYNVTVTNNARIVFTISDLD